MGGIYGLFDNGELTYIGRSDVPEYRIGQHIKQGNKVFNDYRLQYLNGLDINELADVEYNLIKFCHPRDNKQGNTINGAPYISNFCEIRHPTPWNLYRAVGLNDFTWQVLIMLAGVKPQRSLQRIKMTERDFTRWWELETVRKHHKRTRDGRIYRTLYTALTGEVIQ